MAADPTPAHSKRPYLGPGADTATVLACLYPEDRERFREAHEAAVATGDEAGARAAIDRWRGIAMLQADPDRFAEVVREIAQDRTGRPVPADEPLAVTRRAAGM